MALSSVPFGQESILFEQSSNFASGTIPLAGAVAVANNQLPNDAASDGAKVTANIQHGTNTTEWETVRVVYNHAAQTLTRAAGDVIDGSSGPGSLVTFSPGTKRVAFNLAADDLGEVQTLIVYATTLPLTVDASAGGQNTDITTENITKYITVINATTSTIVVLPDTVGVNRIVEIISGSNVTIDVSSWASPGSVFAAIEAGRSSLFHTDGVTPWVAVGRKYELEQLQSRGTLTLNDGDFDGGGNYNVLPTDQKSIQVADTVTRNVTLTVDRTNPDNQENLTAYRFFNRSNSFSAVIQGLNADGLGTSTLPVRPPAANTPWCWIQFRNVSFTLDASFGDLAWLDDITMAEVTDAGALATQDDVTLAQVTDSGALAALDTLPGSLVDDATLTTGKIEPAPENTLLGSNLAGSNAPQYLTLDESKALLDITGMDQVNVSGASIYEWDTTAIPKLYLSGINQNITISAVNNLDGAVLWIALNSTDSYSVSFGSGFNNGGFLVPDIITDPGSTWNLQPLFVFFGQASFFSSELPTSGSSITSSRISIDENTTIARSTHASTPTKQIVLDVQHSTDPGGTGFTLTIPNDAIVGESFDFVVGQAQGTQVAGDGTGVTFTSAAGATILLASDPESRRGETVTFVVEDNVGGAAAEYQVLGSHNVERETYATQSFRNNAHFRGTVVRGARSESLGNSTLAQGNSGCVNNIPGTTCTISGVGEGWNATLRATQNSTSIVVNGLTAASTLDAGEVVTVIYTAAGPEMTPPIAMVGFA